MSGSSSSLPGHIPGALTGRREPLLAQRCDVGEKRPQQAMASGRCPWRGQVGVVGGARCCALVCCYWVWLHFRAQSTTYSFITLQPIPVKALRLKIHDGDGGAPKKMAKIENAQILLSAGHVGRNRKLGDEAMLVVYACCLEERKGVELMNSECKQTKHSEVPPVGSGSVPRLGLGGLWGACPLNRDPRVADPPGGVEQAAIGPSAMASDGLTHEPKVG